MWYETGFILCAEGFSSFIRNYEGHGDVHSIKICRGAPIVSHLFFAYGFFFQNKTQECITMKNILTTYEKALGQAINLQKSKLVFSRNVSQQLHEDILEIMNVNVGLGFGKYMRLSTSMGKS